MMATAGLVVTGDDIPTAFDRFRDRITFPIRDRRGRVIAFGARALDPQARAKYLNSPETPLFHKGNILYNLDQAREAAHGLGRLILVEGYMDVIALAGAGIDYAVAPLGTALTPDQLKLIWRIVPDPVLCFDGDNAGQLAAYRAVDTALPLLQPGHFLKFSFLPPGQDPDDVVNAGGKQMMDRLVDSADALSQVLWQREREKSGLSTPEQRAAFEDRLQKAVEYIRDPAMRAHYRSDYKNRLRDLWRSGAGAEGKSASTGRKGYKRQGGAGEPWRVGGRNPYKSAGPSPHLRHLVRSGMNRPVSEPRERLMLMMLVNYPHLVADNLDTLAELEFESREFDRLRKAILDVIVLEKTLDRTLLRDQLCQRGFERMLKGFENRTTHRSDWFAFADAAQEDVTKAWRHIVALHMKSVTQRRALEAAQQEFAENPTEATLAYLNEVGEHIRSTAGEEAWIDSFGEASGHGGGSPFDQA